MASQIISLPTNEKNIAVVVEANQTLEFAFDISTATFKRPDPSEGEKSPDLVITLEDGTAIVLQDFFAAHAGDQLPTLKLVDGAIIDGGDFLASIDPNFDIATAAGSAATPASGGGISDMADLTELLGNTIDGVDRLDSLGTDQFSNAISPTASVATFGALPTGGTSSNASGNNQGNNGGGGEDGTNGGGELGGSNPAPSYDDYSVGINAEGFVKANFTFTTDEALVLNNTANVASTGVKVDVHYDGGSPGGVAVSGVNTPEMEISARSLDSEHSESSATAISAEQGQFWVAKEFAGHLDGMGSGYSNSYGKDIINASNKNSGNLHELDEVLSHGQVNANTLIESYQVYNLFSVLTGESGYEMSVGQMKDIISGMNPSDFEEMYQNSTPGEKAGYDAQLSKLLSGGYDHVLPMNEQYVAMSTVYEMMHLLGTLPEGLDLNASNLKIVIGSLTPEQLGGADETMVQKLLSGEFDSFLQKLADGAFGGNVSHFGSEQHSGAYLLKELLQKLTLTAEGARYNTGVDVTTTYELGDGWENQSAGVLLAAKELNINAIGGAREGDSASYGIKVLNNSTGNEGGWGTTAGVAIKTSDLNINVDNTKRSVGISADGTQTKVSVTSAEVVDQDTGLWHNAGALSVTITCTITNEVEQLRGIAIEALNGGHVVIQSGSEFMPEEPATNDKITINGDIYAASQIDPDTGYWAGPSNISIDTKGGADQIAVNGNVSLDKSNFTVAAGKGDDLVKIAGDINVGRDSNLTIDAGEGNDIIMLEGKVGGAGAFFDNGDGTMSPTGSLQITGGMGHDMLVLTAPDEATFNEWYKDWLETYGLRGLECESITVQGVNDPQAIAWLQSLVDQTNDDHGTEISLQILHENTHITVVNDISDIDESFVLDGSATDDLLYVRFDAEHSSLDGLSNAMVSGQVKGLEYLMLDMSTPHNSQQISFNQLGSFIDRVTTGHNAPDHIMIKADADDTLGLQNSNWATSGTTETINNVEYTVYQHEDYGSLYVQLITQ